MDQTPASVAQARKTWRLGMVVVLALLAASIGFIGWGKASHDVSFSMAACGVFIVAGLVMMAVSRSRAARDQKFAKGYNATEWFLGRPDLRFQASAFILASLVLTIPVGRALIWLGIIQALKPVLQPVLHPFGIWGAIVFLFLISATLLVGVLLLIGAVVSHVRSSSDGS